ncbi:hypothetical protein A3712_05785 [Vibrio sp. HI00D65]|nr:hypothetical protein A3712_05785 [Vibrio sp. HI00D65]
MIIAMIAVLMMQTPIYDIINVVSMLYGFMATVWTMNMLPTRMNWLALVWINVTIFDNMFIAMVTMWMVQLPID